MDTPNPDDFTTSAASAQDEQLMVKFFYKEVQNKAASLKEGRPIFREKEYIEIRIPGKRDAQACRPASHADKQRFPRHYEAFQKRVEAPAEGTPLTEWPVITRSLAEQLTFINVKTVEQLASVNDAHIGPIMGGYGFRDKAKAWLERAGAERVEEEKVDLLARIASLETQLQSQAPLAPVAPEPVDLHSGLDEAEAEEVLEPVTAVKAVTRARKTRRTRKTVEAATTE